MIDLAIIYGTMFAGVIVLCFQRHLQNEGANAAPANAAPTCIALRKESGDYRIVWINAAGRKVTARDNVSFADCARIRRNARANGYRLI